MPILPPAMLVYKVSRRVPSAILSRHVRLCTSLCGRHLPFPCVVSHILCVSYASGLARQHGSRNKSCPSIPDSFTFPFWATQCVFDPVSLRQSVCAARARYAVAQMPPAAKQVSCDLRYAAELKAPSYINRNLVRRGASINEPLTTLVCSRLSFTPLWPPDTLTDAVRLPPAFLPLIEALVIRDTMSLSQSRASHCRGLEARNTRGPTPMAAGRPAREAAVSITDTMDDH